MVTPREKSCLPEAQKRIEPATLHHTGQRAQHSTGWPILAPDLCSRSQLCEKNKIFWVFHFLVNFCQFGWNFGCCQIRWFAEVYVGWNFGCGQICWFAEVYARLILRNTHPRESDFIRYIFNNGWHLGVFDYFGVFAPLVWRLIPAPFVNTDITV